MKRGCLIELRRNRKGSMAIVFALALIPLLGFVGLATDYAKSLLVKRRLELAIDSAALASVKRTVDLLNDGQTSQSSAIQQGEAEGKAYMAAQSQRLMDTDLSAVNVKVTIDGSTITSQTGYAAGVPTAFAQLFGVKTFQIAGNSGASMTLSPYVNVHVLVDISQSMGIGATDEDQKIIRNMKVRRWGNQPGPNGCAFGCHIAQAEFQSNDPRYPFLNTYDMAHEAGAKMRIDVVRNAVQKLSANLLSRSDKRYQVAIHTFHSTFATLQPLTGNGAVAAAAISKLDTSTTGGGTNAHIAFQKLSSVIKTPGDGMTQDKAKAIVILMTDGTEDNQTMLPLDWRDYKDPNFVYFDPGAADDGGRVQSFDPKICKALKDSSIQIIALNTKYIVPAQDWNVKFQAIKDWLHIYIDNNMASCVSSTNDYYDASSPEEIDNAITQITSSISKPLALTR